MPKTIQAHYTVAIFDTLVECGFDCAGVRTELRPDHNFQAVFTTTFLDDAGKRWACQWTCEDDELPHHHTIALHFIKKWNERRRA